MENKPTCGNWKPKKIDQNLCGDFDLKNLLSHTDYIADELQKKMRTDFSIKLEEYLVKNLKKRGFEFKNQSEFFDFCKNRIQRVEFREEEEVHYYLDFISKDEPGDLVGVTHENRVRFFHENGNIIGTVG